MSEGDQAMDYGQGGQMGQNEPRGSRKSQEMNLRRSQGQAGGDQGGGQRPSGGAARRGSHSSQRGGSQRGSQSGARRASETLQNPVDMYAERHGKQIVNIGDEVTAGDEGTGDEMLAPDTGGEGGTTSQEVSSAEDNPGGAGGAKQKDQKKKKKKTSGKKKSLEMAASKLNITLEQVQDIFFGSSELISTEKEIIEGMMRKNSGLSTVASKSVGWPVRPDNDSILGDLSPELTQATKHLDKLYEALWNNVVREKDSFSESYSASMGPKDHEFCFSFSPKDPQNGIVNTHFIVPFEHITEPFLLITSGTQIAPRMKGETEDKYQHAFRSFLFPPGYLRIIDQSANSNQKQRQYSEDHTSKLAAARVPGFENCSLRFCGPSLFFYDELVFTINDNFWIVTPGRVRAMWPYLYCDRFFTDSCSGKTQECHFTEFRFDLKEAFKRAASGQKIVCPVGRSSGSMLDSEAKAILAGVNYEDMLKRCLEKNDPDLSVYFITCFVAPFFSKCSRAKINFYQALEGNVQHFAEDLVSLFMYFVGMGSNSMPTSWPILAKSTDVKWTNDRNPHSVKKFITDTLVPILEKGTLARKVLFLPKTAEDRQKQAEREKKLQQKNNKNKQQNDQNNKNNSKNQYNNNGGNGNEQNSQQARNQAPPNTGGASWQKAGAKNQQQQPDVNTVAAQELKLARIALNQHMLDKAMPKKFGCKPELFKQTFVPDKDGLRALIPNPDKGDFYKELDRGDKLDTDYANDPEALPKFNENFEYSKGGASADAKKFSIDREQVTENLKFQFRHPRKLLPRYNLAAEDSKMDEYVVPFYSFPGPCYFVQKKWRQDGDDKKYSTPSLKDDVAKMRKGQVEIVDCLLLPAGHYRSFSKHAMRTYNKSHVQSSNEKMGDRRMQISEQHVIRDPADIWTGWSEGGFPVWVFRVPQGLFFYKQHVYLTGEGYMLSYRKPVYLHFMGLVALTRRDLCFSRNRLSARIAEFLWEDIRDEFWIEKIAQNRYADFNIWDEHNRKTISVFREEVISHVCEYHEMVLWESMPNATEYRMVNLMRKALCYFLFKLEFMCKTLARNGIYDNEEWKRKLKHAKKASLADDLSELMGWVMQVLHTGRYTGPAPKNYEWKKKVEAWKKSHSKAVELDLQERRILLPDDVPLEPQLHPQQQHPSYNHPPPRQQPYNGQYGPPPGHYPQPQPHQQYQNQQYYPQSGGPPAASQPPFAPQGQGMGRGRGRGVQGQQGFQGGKMAFSSMQKSGQPAAKMPTMLPDKNLYVKSEVKWKPPADASEEGKKSDSDHYHGVLRKMIARLGGFRIDDKLYHNSTKPEHIVTRQGEKAQELKDREAWVLERRKRLESERDEVIKRGEELQRQKNGAVGQELRMRKNSQQADSSSGADAGARLEGNPAQDNGGAAAQG